MMKTSRVHAAGCVLACIIHGISGLGTERHES
jgi:hypothetical protein